MKPHDTEPESPDDELVPADDAVIGRAVRRSVAVVAIAGALVGGGWLLLRWRSTEPTTNLAPTVAAPVAVAPAQVTLPAIRFTDVAAAAGIDFVHVSGATGEKLLPESMGGGVVVADLDGDGDNDLLFPNGAPWPGNAVPAGAQRGPRLYRNDGNWQFVDVSTAAGLAFDEYGMGTAVGDFDGDGLLDLYFTNLGFNRLYRNLGDLRFADVTKAAGVAGAETWSTGATFFDLDRDGDLDLFVTNYVVWNRTIDLEVDYRLTGVGRAYGPPADYAGTQPALFVNRGDGTFEDRSAAVAVVNPATGVPVGKGLGVAPIDLDRDGWTDLVVANDTVRNFVYHNREGTLEEVGELWGLAYDRNGTATGAMGLDVAYHRNDESLGLAIGNFANEMSSLYVSQSDPTIFADEAIAEGIGAASRSVLSFGILFVDLDLDGRLDLVQNNGHLETDIARVDPNQSYQQASQLFWNAGPEAARPFELLGAELLGDLARPIVGRGSAYGDLDSDGDLDLVVCQTGSTPLVLRNDLAAGQRSLRLRLADQGSPNRHAFGALVEVEADGHTMRRVVTPTRSYLSQSELAVTFGLASTPTAITVIWPDGSRESLDPAAYPVDGVTRTVARTVTPG